MKRIFKLSLTTLAVSLSMNGWVLAAPTATPATTDIGYVDLQKAVQSVDSGQKAKELLAKEFERRKNEIQTRQDELKKMQDEFEKKSMVMNEKSRMEKQAEFQRKFQDFQEFYQKSQMEMAQKEKDLTQPIFEEMETLIKEIAQERKLSFVLEKTKSAVLYAPNDRDYTSLLIEKYQKKNKK